MPWAYIRAKAYIRDVNWVTYQNKYQDIKILKYYY